MGNANRGDPYRRISLRHRSVWLTVVFCVAFASCIALALAAAINVQRVATRAGTSAAPVLMDELHVLANAEKLIILGDQLVSADNRELWMSAGIAMQALIYHPSLRHIFDGPESVKDSYRSIGEILALRDEREMLSASAEGELEVESRLALKARSERIWAEQRALFTRLADGAAVSMVERTTGGADEISRLADVITLTTALSAVVGLSGSLILLIFARNHLLRPLLSVADFLSAQRRGLGDTVALAPARSVEMARVYEAAESLSAAQEALREMAFRDRLTGLANRHALEIHLDQAVASARRDGDRVAVLFIDLDRFKSVNDLLGHMVGDALIVEIARRLKGCVRESDTVARLGGDEFIIVLNDVHDPRDAAAVAEKLLNLVALPVVVENHHLECTASIGICLYPDDGEDRSTLMKNADIAMYSAKAARRGAFRYFDAELHREVGERLQLEAELARAIKDEQFVLHYQPIVDSLSGRVTTLEALLRWNRPGVGLVPPDRFIPLLEETGLIAEAGRWVAREACRALKRWHASGLDGLRVAINISARQFHTHGFCDELAQVLSSTGVAPADVELELTESVAMEDPKNTIAGLRALRTLGVSLAIDDFGTGYSSLAYLKLFPINRLKIDRTFVRELEVDESDTAICIATIDLARRLKLQVVAEGVETLSQFHYLRRLGCQYVQGYHFSRPLPESEIAAYVRERMNGALFGDAGHGDAATKPA